MPLSRVLRALVVVIWAGNARAAAPDRPALKWGNCVGEGPALPAPAKTPPYDVARNPLAQESTWLWTELGYRIDDKRGRLLSPKGEEVSAPEVERALGAFDARRERVDATTWGWLHTVGIRLNESDCRLRNDKGLPMNRLDSLSAHLGGDIRRIISDESKPKGFGELQ